MFRIIVYIYIYTIIIPEIIEIFYVAKWLNHKFKGKNIEEITVVSGRYKKKHIPGIDLFNTTKPFTILEISSKGKVIWFKVKNKNNQVNYIFNRFGLSGEWLLDDSSYTRIKLDIDGIYLYFSDLRNFGIFEIINSDEWKRRVDGVGDDLLQTKFTVDDIKKKLKDYLVGKGNVRGNKEVIRILMDQKIVGSGIGNYLGAEILYHAKISPHTKIINIYKNNNLLKKLVHSIKYIIKLSYLSKNIKYMHDKNLIKFIEKTRKEKKYDFHADIKVGKNDKFVFNVYRQKIDPHGNIINTSKIITGRTTYWSPIQK